MKIVDEHLEENLANLRSSVPSTRSAILESRKKNNRRRTQVPAAIITGVFLQQLAANIAVTEVTFGLVLRRIGNAMAAASFAGSRVQRLVSIELNCGLSDLEEVLDQYTTLFNLEQAYEPYLSYGGPHPSSMPPELWPDALQFHVVYFGINAREAVSCLLEEGGSSSGLSGAIGAVQSDISRRLGLSKQLLEAKKKSLEPKEEATTSAPSNQYNQVTPVPGVASYQQNNNNNQYNQATPVPGVASYQQNNQYQSQPPSNQYQSAQNRHDNHHQDWPTKASGPYIYQTSSENDVYSQYHKLLTDSNNNHNPYLAQYNIIK